MCNLQLKRNQLKEWFNFREYDFVIAGSYIRYPIETDNDTQAANSNQKAFMIAKVLEVIEGCNQFDG